MNICTRILWLSDIHYRDYTNNKDVEKLINAFLKAVNADVVKSKIDYILITGDIAFGGFEEEYNAFQTAFLDPLKKIIDVPVITIPGNHDVNWKSIHAFFNKPETDIENNITKKDEFLNKNQSDFFTLFDDYVKHFKVKSVTLQDKPFAPDSYNGHKLFGIHKDEERKLIFVLFNSAWFCVSSRVQELAKDKTIDERLHLQKYTNEIGQQIIGQTIMNFDAWKTEISKYKDYRIITCMHHPLHWLSWNEIHGYDVNSRDNRIVPHVLQYTDLFLTGHEHVPIYIPPSNIFDGAWHLQAGYFMEDNLKSDQSPTDLDTFFKHNRFSILEIQDNTFNEIPYLYDKSNQAFSIQKKRSGILRKKKTQINDSFKDAKISEFYEKKISQEIINYYASKKGISLTLTSETNYPLTIGHLATIHKFVNNEETWFFIVPSTNQKNLFYQETLTSFENEANFMDKVGIGSGLNYVVFFSLDLIVNSTKYKEFYEEKDLHRAYSEIVSEADLYFDRFRHLFFNRPYNFGPNQPLNNFLKVNFINEVVPFWRNEIKQ